MRVSSDLKTVLVVDDHDIVRELIAEILEQQGYRVLQASGAAEAIQILEQHQSTIDLMLSDFLMPGMRGTELARFARKIRPPMKVLLMSAMEGGDEVIAKPFEPEVLERRIRSLLGE